MNGVLAAVRRFYDHLNDRYVAAIDSIRHVTGRFEDHYFYLILTVAIAVFAAVGIYQVKTGSAKDFLFREIKRSEDPLYFWVLVFQVPIFAAVIALIILGLWLYTGGPSPF